MYIRHTKTESNQSSGIGDKVKNIKLLFFFILHLTFESKWCIIIYVVEVWLSLVEYYVRDVGAAGSNPVTSTSKKACIFTDVEVQAFFVNPIT